MTAKINSIMFIDDDSMSNLNNKRIIEKANVAKETHYFEQPEEALEMLRTVFLPAGKVPEIIFLDIYMPGVNGWQVLDELRACGLSQDNTRIILLSASNDDADRERAIKIPEVSGYKIKPLTEEYILELAHKPPATN